MKHLIGGLLAFVCAGISSVGIAQAQPEENAEPAAKAVLQVGPGETLIRGSRPATSPAQPDALDVSPELVAYLQRTLRDHQREIDRREQPGRPEPPTPPAKSKDEQPAKPQDGSGTIDRKQFHELIGRLEQAEAKLAQLKAGDGKQPPAAAEPQLRTLLDSPYVGTMYTGGNNNVRFFVARLVVVNPTAGPVVLKRKEVQLTSDGKTYDGEAISPRVKGQSFQMGNRGVHLGSLQFPDDVTVPAGETGAMWVVFENLPLGNNVPAMSLAMQLDGRQVVLDVNRFSRDVLGLTVVRIGPRGSLGLLTIAGSMNMVNIGSLVDALDALTADKVFRVVIRWDKSAAVVESQIGSWLQQAAYHAGRNQRNNNDNRFPIVPAAISELHLAQLPNQSGSTRYYSPYGPSATPIVHKTDREAVSAALHTAYNAISRDDLLREIGEGHPLTRAAALEGGGGRLASDDLPLILDYARGNDADMQRAAMVALRHFGEPDAIELLLKQAGEGQDPPASVAIESLAGSRFSAAHAALLDVLKTASPELKKKIVAIVARYPRPVWGDVIYEFATSGDAEVSVVALRALVSLGHPKLIDVLESSLAGEVEPLRAEAFKILVSRTDSRSEELAMQHALAHMQTSPPTPQMLQLLNRTRDRRALPLLLAHFEKLKESPSERNGIINALVQIGDQTVVEVLLERYASLSSQEQSMVLNMLWQFRSPKFRELAGAALLSKDSNLVNAACQGLQEDGSPKAVSLLTGAFEKTDNATAWSYISNALSNLGTAEARAALEKGTRSKNANRRTYSVGALRNLRQRSPGYQHIYMAQQFEQQKKWKEAIEQYSLAAQIDPDLPEAFSGRGNALMRQDKHKEAGKDFARALKLDPFNSIALTGLGIARVMEGKTAEGIKLVEEGRDKFKNDALFAYNAACVYGRALEAVQKDEKAADRDQKIAEYQKQALADLEQSVKLGFRDRNWMKQDPDLKSLHGLEEFKQLHSPAGEAKPEEPADLDDEGEDEAGDAPAVQTEPAADVE